jgi:hypothetical protein
VSLSTEGTFPLPFPFKAGLPGSALKSLGDGKGESVRPPRPSPGTDLSGLLVVGVGRSMGLSGNPVWRFLLMRLKGCLGESTKGVTTPVVGVLGSEIGCGLRRGGGSRGEKL